MIDELKLKVSTAWSDTEDQRDAANEDMRFCNVDGGMWEDWFEATHGEDTNRAKLELDLISDFVNRYVGEWTENRAQVLYSPDDPETSEDDSELLAGIYRANFNDNDGQMAYDNAIAEAAECGYGCLKISTRFEDEEDPENDKQEIVFKPIYNAYSRVIFDPTSKRPDKADAKWGTELVTYSPEAYEEAYPDNTPCSAFTPDENHGLDWNTPDTVTVCEYYEIEKEKKTVHVYRNVEQNKIEAYPDADIDLIKNELKEDGWEFVRKRKLMTKSVYKTIFSGEEILEERTRIAGKFIPLIPMFGFRKYVDNAERYRGLVRKLKDANRLFNMTVSRLGDSAAASPDSKPIFTDSQIAGKEAIWQSIHKKAYGLLNDVYDANGNPMPAGPVGYTQPSQVDQNTLACGEIINNYVQRATGNAPQDTIDPDASGKAINALMKRENLNTQVMSDNIVQSIKHSGDVYKAIAAEVLIDERDVRTLSVDGSESTTRINGSVFDSESGKWVASTQLGGRFKVTVDVGPQYETEREQTVETLERVIELIGPDDEFYRPALTMYLKNIKGVGLKEFQKVVRISAIRQGLIEPESDEEKQMVQQMAQQVDPATQLQQAAAQQQQAEAESLMASVEQKRADTKKKEAETAEIISQLPQRFIYNPETGALDSADSRVA